MSSTQVKLELLPCLDSVEMSTSRRQELDIPRKRAAALGRSALKAARIGYYINRTLAKSVSFDSSQSWVVDWSQNIQSACSAKQSISPDDPLPTPERIPHAQTQVQVSNETTLQASRRLVDSGLRPMALNFADGIQPGGGFVLGLRTQEEVLCRSSALYQTLVDDPMYAHHLEHAQGESTDWAIYSPDVPVFRTDDGKELNCPWPLSILTSAAPYVPDVGQPKSGDLLQKRIHRVLAIAHAYGHSELVLGAWGCGAFKNDPHRTAVDFRHALETDFNGLFSLIVFAITDWSTERKFLGPFRDVFS